MEEERNRVRNMKSRIAICILIFSFGFGPGGIAANVQPSGQLHYLTFDEAVQIALHDNVDLLAIREQAEGLKHLSRQALSPNEPVFSYLQSDKLGWGFNQTASETLYQVSWTLGFPGKALAQSASVRHQAEATTEQALNQEITVISLLSNSFVTFVTNDASYKFLLEEQRKDKELIKLLEKRFGASQAAKVDLLNAKVVTQQIAQSILQNRNDYELQLTEFRHIIKRPSDKTLFPRIPEQIIIPPLEKSFDALVEIMNKNSHAIAQAQKVVDGSTSLLTSAKLQALPDLQLSGSVNDWTPQASPNENVGVTQSYSLGIGISVPIFFAFNELEGVKSAQHSKSAAEYQLTSQQLQAVNGLETAYTSLKAALKDLEASEKLVVPAAKESYDLTLLTYSLGKADYFALNQSRKAWHEAMKDLLTKRQNAAQFYNQLIAQIGCDISRPSGGPNACN